STLLATAGALNAQGANEMRAGLGTGFGWGMGVDATDVSEGDNIATVDLVDGDDSESSETDKDKDATGSSLSRRDLHLWAEVIGAQQNQDGSKGVASVRQRATGVFLGGDAQVNRDWRVGLAFGYTDNRIDVNDRGSHANAKSYSASVTAGRAFELKRG